MNHPNIVELLGKISPTNPNAKLQLVFKFYRYSLKDVIDNKKRTSKSPFRQGLVVTKEHAKFLMIHILDAVSYIHELKILHRDIKVLINFTLSMLFAK